MATATESVRSGEFLLSEGNGHISREEITVVSGAGVLSAGQVLGEITASGKYTAYAPAATDGTEVAAGILYGQVDAAIADVKGLAIMRLAEVKEVSLTGFDAAAEVDFASQNIFVR